MFEGHKEREAIKHLQEWIERLEERIERLEAEVFWTDPNTSPGEAIDFVIQFGTSIPKV